MTPTMWYPRRHALSLSLLLLCCCVRAAAALSASAPATEAWRLRPARRGDLWRVATLLNDAFVLAPGGRDVLAVLETKVRLALDVEKRLTPWDWCARTCPHQKPPSR